MRGSAIQMLRRHRRRLPLKPLLLLLVAAMVLTPKFDDGTTRQIDTALVMGTSAVRG